MSSTRLARRPVPVTPQPGHDEAGGRGHTVAAVVLGALLVLGAGASVVGVFDPSPPGNAGAGAPAPVTSGQAELVHVEHVPPESFGASLPDGSHAVQVTMSVTASAAAAASFDGLAVRMSGEGIAQPIAPASASPDRLVLAPGATGTVTALFAVPDQSTDLVLTLPDGTVVSAEHENHPGDRSADD
jgi:hypothetical protein